MWASSLLTSSFKVALELTLRNSVCVAPMGLEAPTY
jgi:hypothetical protein